MDFLPATTHPLSPLLPSLKDNSCDVLDGNLPPQLGGGLGVFLDVLSLLDELVFGRGAGKTTLGGCTQLRRKARGGSGDGSREHFGQNMIRFGYSMAV